MRLACALAFALLPCLAWAQSVTPDQAKALRTACAADATRLCATATADDALFQCLKDQRETLLPPCAATLGALIVSQRRPKP